jgi:hypothetical protein
MPLMTIDTSSYNDTFRRLASEAVACVPDFWNQGRLTITMREGSLHYLLENDAKQTGAAATQQLGRLCGELYLLMQMDGQEWSQCIIAFARTATDGWNFDVKFKYLTS